MEIYVSEHNGKMVAVLLDDEMKIVKPVYIRSSTRPKLMIWSAKILSVSQKR